MLAPLLILGTIVVAVFGGVLPLMGMISEKKHYGNELERYILSRNPQNEADVERFQNEYTRKQIKLFP